MEVLVWVTHWQVTWVRPQCMASHSVLCTSWAVYAALLYSVCPLMHIIVSAMTMGSVL